MMHRLRQLNAIRVPRQTVVVLCALLLAPLALARAHNLLMTSGSNPQWVHHHTLNYTVCNEISASAPSSLHDQADNSRSNWNTALSGSNTPYPNPAPSLSAQSNCHPSGGTAADLQLLASNYGDTGWRASSMVDEDWPFNGNNAYNSRFHGTHTHIRFNLYTITSSFGGYNSRTVACREIGYAMGLKYVSLSTTGLGQTEHPSSGAASNTNDCMSFSSVNQVGKDADATNFTYTYGAGPHSVDLLREAYGNHGPDASLGGPLVTETNAGHQLTDAGYGLDVSANGGPDIQSGIKSIEIKVDGTQKDFAQQGCTGPPCNMSRPWTFNTADYSPGQHTITVNIKDQSDFLTVKTLTVTVADAPETTIGTKPNDPSGTANPDLSYSASQSNSSFQCELDGGAYSSCSGSGTSYSALADGSHTFKVRGTNGAGRTDQTPASYSWTIDAVAPDTTIDSGTGGPINTSSASFSFSSNRSNATFECRADNGSWTSCASPRNYTDVPEGTHTFSARAVGLGGHDETPASRAFAVDLTPPDTTVDSGPAASTNSATVNYAFSSSETNATFECRVDSGWWAACDSPKEFTGLSDGTHSLQARAVDPAGNLDGSPAARSVTVHAQATADAKAIALAHFPAEVAQTEGVQDPEDDNTTFSPTFDSTDQDLEAAGGLADGSAARQYDDGETVGDETFGAALTPDQVGGSAAPASLIGQDVAIYADTAPSVDTIVRPTILGTESFEQIRGSEAPETFSWTVDMTENQRLELLDNGSVAIVEDGPEPDTDEITETAVAEDPADAEWQFEMAREESDAAAAQTQGQVVATLPKPTARDETGRQLVTSLSVSGNRVTLDVDHHAGNVAYPVLAARPLVSSADLDINALCQRAFVGDPDGYLEFCRYQENTHEEIGEAGPDDSDPDLIAPSPDPPSGTEGGAAEADPAPVDSSDPEWTDPSDPDTADDYQDGSDPFDPAYDFSQGDDDYSAGTSSNSTGTASKQEKDWCKKSFAKAAACFQYTKDARLASNLDEYLYTGAHPQSDNTRTNAFRHSFWVALMVLSVRSHSDWAMGEARRHEHGVQRRSTNTRARRNARMDILNDRKGWHFGKGHTSHNNEYMCFHMRKGTATRHGSFIGTRTDPYDWYHKHGHGQLVWRKKYDSAEFYVKFNDTDCSPVSGDS